MSQVNLDRKGTYQSDIEHNQHHYCKMDLLYSYTRRYLHFQSKQKPLNVNIDRQVSEEENHIDCNDIRHCKERGYASPNLGDKFRAWAFFFLLQFQRCIHSHITLAYMTRSIKSKDSCKGWLGNFGIDDIDSVSNWKHTCSRLRWRNWRGKKEEVMRTENKGSWMKPLTRSVCSMAFSWLGRPNVVRGYYERRREGSREKPGRGNCA